MSFRLYADLGNMTLHWGVFVEGEWLAVDRISAGDDLARCAVASLNAMLQDAHMTLDGCSGGLLCSSSPRLTPQLVAALKQHAGLALPELDEATSARVPTLYHDPRQIGRDRLANAAAVRAYHECPAIVADVGSCITVDLIDADGVLVGGAIAPGLPAMKAGLAAQTPHLGPALDALAPPIDFSTPGRSTEECIALGIYASLAAATRGLCEHLSRGLGDVPVLMTGGDAAWVQSVTGFADVVDGMLTLKGLQSLDRDE